LITCGAALSAQLATDTQLVDHLTEHFAGMTTDPIGHQPRNVLKHIGLITQERGEASRQ